MARISRTPLGQRPHPRPLHRVEALDAVAHRVRRRARGSRPAAARRRRRGSPRRGRWLTSGTAISVMVNCGRCDDRLARRLDPAGDVPAQVVLRHHRPGGEHAREHRHAEVDRAPEARPQPEPVQPVAQPRGRRVAAGGGPHREHEASSTSQRTSAPKDMPHVRRLLGRERGRRHAGLGVGLEDDRARPSPRASSQRKSRAAEPAAAERPVRAERVVEAGVGDLGRDVGRDHVARAAGRVLGVVVVPAVGDDVGDGERPVAHHRDGQLAPGDVLLDQHASRACRRRAPAAGWRRRARCRPRPTSPRRSA